MRFPLLLLVVVVLGACNSVVDVRVKGNACTGCLDSNGLCVAGTEAFACGLNGVACLSCASGQQCTASGSCVNESGTGGAGGGSAGFGGGTGADAGFDDCSAAAKLVYVVDQDRTLSSFNPALLGTSGGPFVDLGRIQCPAQSGAEPFSMAVDRNATAWIVYDSGELFTVNVNQVPLTCVKTTFARQNGVAKFGMGFVSNSAGSSDETLFISGSDLTSSLTTTKFGTLSTTPPYTVTVLGTLTGAPEISGTGDGKLWAFFPHVTPPKVSELSKTSGATLGGFTAQTLTGSPRAWAFAFWGGDFFIFLERDNDLSTNVWKLDGQTGALTNVVPNSGRRIVGAGVSTCAPVEIN
jgi:hypothetical protein